MNALIHWRDWPDALAWIAAIATIAAAWFAAIAIRQAHKIAEASMDASIQERQIDHDLSVLRSMAEVIAGQNYMVLAGLVNMAAPRLPLTRAAFDIGPTQAETAGYEATVDARFEAAGRDRHPAAFDGAVAMLESQWRKEIAIEEIASCARQLINDRSSISGVSRGRK